MQNIENKFYTTIYILMGMSMLSWAVAWTSAKIVNNYLSFYNLVFFRFLLGFISLIPLIAGKYFFSLFKLNKINLLYIIITSFLFFVYNVCFFMGTHYGFAGKGAILVTTINPLITALIISMIKKKISKSEIQGLFLGLIGGSFILNIYVDGFIQIFNITNIYFLICAITWGIITVLTNYAQKDISPQIFIFLCYFCTSIIAVFFADFGTIDFNKFDYIFYLNFFLVSIGAMSFGTTIYMYATSYLGPIKASVFIFSVPFIAMATAFIFLNEPITLNIVIGGLLSLLGIYIINKK